MGIQSIFVFTHDSIFVGEDGPTHEPIEQMASLRLIPGMTVIRPADGPEVAAAWAWALRHTDGPTALIFTRQNVPAIARAGEFSVEAFNRGAYVVDETAGDEPEVVMVGTGSELQFAAAAKADLEAKGKRARIVSMPSREIFMAQDEAYRKALLPAAARKVVLEAAVSFGWADIVGSEALFICQDDYGYSASAQDLMLHLGWNDEAVAKKVVDWVGD